jgi:hypothetical protein
MGQTKDGELQREDAQTASNIPFSTSYHTFTKVNKMGYSLSL